MKKLRKPRKFQTQAEMFEYFELDLGKRGKERNAQMKLIRKTHVVEKRANGSYLVTPITKKYQQRQKGQLVTIDGIEVNLEGRNVYAKTGIRDYIDYIILTNADPRFKRTDTKPALINQCFCRSKLFKELLLRDNDDIISHYDKNALEIVNKYVLRRLYSLVDSEITRLEKAGIIEVSTYYIDEKHYKIDLSEEDEEEIIQKALYKAGCKNKFEACSNSIIRPTYLKIRNTLIQEKTGHKPVAKKYYLSFSDSISPEEYNNYKNEYYFGAQESQIILTKFFDIFRAKICHTLSKKDDFGKDATKLLHLDGKEEAISIVNEYCAYMTTPSTYSIEPAEAFYNIEDLLSWQEERNKAWTDEYDDTLYCSTREMNFYALSF